jgi:hypothetical protein
MRISSLRPVMVTAAIIASAGILAGGLALRPAFAVGGTASVGPFTVVHCTSASPCQIYNNGGKGAGLQGINSNTNAPFGSGLTGTASTYGNGVNGFAQNGNAISGTAGAGIGVAGSSSSNFGVYGYSSNWYGVEGQSVNAHGVEAFSSTSTGLEAASSSGIPIVAISESGSPAEYVLGSTGDGIDVSSSGGGGTTAVNATNTGGNGSVTVGGYIGVIARAPDCNSGSGYSFVGTDQNNNDLMFVDCAGNMYVHGGYGTFAKTHRGNVATAFTSKVTTPTVEDNGTGHLVNGVAMVQLDPSFADTIDTSREYHVMLTANGDTRGLFVASKTPAGFMVREVQGGRSTIDFDYHIYATALGQSAVHMTELTKAQAAAMMPKAVTVAPHRPQIKLPVLHH